MNRIDKCSITIILHDLSGIFLNIIFSEPYRIINLNLNSAGIVLQVREEIQI